MSRAKKHLTRKIRPERKKKTRVTRSSSSLIKDFIRSINSYAASLPELKNMTEALVSQLQVGGDEVFGIEYKKYISVLRENVSSMTDTVATGVKVVGELESSDIAIRDKMGIIASNINLTTMLLEYSTAIVQININIRSVLKAHKEGNKDVTLPPLASEESEVAEEPTTKETVSTDAKMTESADDVKEITSTETQVVEEDTLAPVQVETTENTH